MPENTIHRLLRETFPKADKELWLQAASQELGGKDAFENLIWRSQDEIEFFPYYDESDTTHLRYLGKFYKSAPDNPPSAPGNWLSAPIVTTTDAIQSNKSALDHLSNGADSILFVLTPNTRPDILLHEIVWPYCSLFFKSAAGNSFFRELPAYIREAKFDMTSLAGSFFWESSPKKSDIAFFVDNTKSLKSLGVSIMSSSPAREISDGLLSAVNMIEQFKSEFPIERVINAVAFSIPLSTNFLESIAKLKALRLLWTQVANAYGVTDAAPLHIHANSPKWISEKFEPHGNMIRGTLAAMAAVIGGCDSLSVEPQDAGNSSLTRIARNISCILKEESHMNKVADALAGAYAVDTMTDAIAKKSWQLFQTNMSK